MKKIILNESDITASGADIGPFRMNWADILANANIPEPPGRAQTVAAANAKTAARKADKAAAEAAKRKPR
jgi:hypothetical protein